MSVPAVNRVQYALAVIVAFSILMLVYDRFMPPFKKPVFQQMDVTENKVTATIHMEKRRDECELIKTSIVGFAGIENGLDQWATKLTRTSTGAEVVKGTNHPAGEVFTIGPFDWDIAPDRPVSRVGISFREQCLLTTQRVTWWFDLEERV